MEKPDSAMASLVPKPSMAIHIGATTTPPPIPPAVQSNMRILMQITPAISNGFPGNTSLCTHVPVRATLSVISQYSKSPHDYVGPQKSPASRRIGCKESLG
jgi:hypothetical protein